MGFNIVKLAGLQFEDAHTMLFQSTGKSIFNFLPWRWRQYIISKFCYLYSISTVISTKHGIHGVSCRKTEFLMLVYNFWNIKVTPDMCFCLTLLNTLQSAQRNCSSYRAVNTLRDHLYTVHNHALSWFNVTIKPRNTHKRLRVSQVHVRLNSCFACSKIRLYQQDESVKNILENNFRCG